MAERTVVKKVENAVLYSDGTILLKNLRASYPHVLMPREEANDEGKKTKKWDLVGLMQKTTHRAAKDLVKGEIDRILAEKKAKIATDKRFLKNGDEAGKDGYEGHYTISASETKKPIVKDRDKRKMADDEDDRFYGGCWVNALIRPWWQDNKYGRRVNAGLVAVQFLRDGEPMGEGSRISEDDVDETFDDESQGWEGAEGDDEL